MDRRMERQTDPLTEMQGTSKNDQGWLVSDCRVLEVGLTDGRMDGQKDLLMEMRDRIK